MVDCEWICSILTVALRATENPPVTGRGRFARAMPARAIDLTPWLKISTNTSDGLISRLALSACGCVAFGLWKLVWNS
jgi:hypothetical protein